MDAGRRNEIERETERERLFFLVRDITVYLHVDGKDQWKEKTLPSREERAEVLEHTLDLVREGGASDKADGQGVYLRETEQGGWAQTLVREGCGRESVGVPF